MTDKQLIKILRKALEIAGQYARDNVPAEINFNYVWCLVDGQSDPKGIKYIDKWISDAIKEISED